MASNVLILIIFSLLSSLCASNKLTKHFPADPQVVKIVGIFGKDEVNETAAFLAAVDDVNQDSGILRKTFLNATVELVDLYDTFTVEKRLCACMKENISAVFGANSEDAALMVRSITDTFHIPYIFSLLTIPMYEDSYSVNIFPRMEDLSRGIKEIIRHTNWETFTLIYEKKEDLLMFQDTIIKHDELRHKEGFEPIKLEQFPEDGDFGPLLKRIGKETETRFVLRCAQDKVLDFLRNARDLKLTGPYFSYVVISLDAIQLDFDEFRGNNTNITTLSIMDPVVFIDYVTDPDYEQVSEFVHKNITRFSTTAALMYDAVYLFAKALDIFFENAELEQVSLDCANDKEIFNDGDSLTSFIKHTEIKGITGPIKLNEKGERIVHKTQVVQVSPSRGTLGTWDPDNTMNLLKNRSQLMEEAANMILNRTFNVSSIIGAPYLRYCKEGKTDPVTGEVCVEGFSKDLIEAMAKEGKFKYKMVLAPDGERGRRLPNGKWTGIIKEVRERRADLGICDLTITHERRQAVDFTKPFMTLGVSILYRKGKQDEKSLYSFLDPLHLQVWLCVTTSLLGISIFLFIISRLTPYDWESSHPCDADVEELENQLSLINCMWFSLGSVLQQGCDILPKALSSRIVAAMWWFFTLIMVSTYTANLAAFLTTQQMDTDITDVKELADQSKIKYGCYSGGSTATFFKDSKEDLYQKMWATMTSDPAVLTTSNEKGISRVLNEKNYAFLMESCTIEYYVERHCSLTQIGNQLDNKGFGIAMPLNSPYRTAITAILLSLQENGKVKNLIDKWWKEGSQNCTSPQPDGNENALNVEKVGGVFVVLAIGMVLSFSLSIMEFLWNIRKVAVIEKIPLSVAFQKELRFVLDFRATTKPVRKPSEKSSLLNEPQDRYKEIMALNISQNQLYVESNFK